MVILSNPDNPNIECNHVNGSEKLLISNELIAASAGEANFRNVKA